MYILIRSARGDLHLQVCPATQRPEFLFKVSNRPPAQFRQRRLSRKCPPQVQQFPADEIRVSTEKGISMTWLRNLPIARKFTLAFGTVCEADFSPDIGGKQADGTNAQRAG